MRDADETDPFLRNMFASMSPGAEYLFSPYHLDEIKKAFSARSFGANAVDLRYSLRLFHGWYCVFLAGRERRLGSRGYDHFVRTSSTFAALAIAAFVLLAI